MLRQLTAIAATTKTIEGRSEAASSAIGVPTKTPSKKANAATTVPMAPVRAALPIAPDIGSAPRPLERIRAALTSQSRPE